MDKPPLHAVRTLRPQGPPAGIYASKFSADLAIEICNRLAAGERLAAICRNPSMPTAKTVWNWTRQHPGFAWAYREALTSARGNREAERARRTEAARVAKAEKRAARGWRPTPPWPDTYTEAIGELICERLARGEPLQSVCEGEVVAVATVYNWLRRHPEFRRCYLLARRAASDIEAEMARESLPWLGSWSASVRELRRRERAVLTQRGRLWPKAFEGPPLWRDVALRPVADDGSGGEGFEVSWDEPYDMLKDAELWCDP